MEILKLQLLQHVQELVQFQSIKDKCSKKKSIEKNDKNLIIQPDQEFCLFHQE